MQTVDLFIVDIKIKNDDQYLLRSISDWAKSKKKQFMTLKSSSLFMLFPKFLRSTRFESEQMVYGKIFVCFFPIKYDENEGSAEYNGDFFFFNCSELFWMSSNEIIFIPFFWFFFIVSQTKESKFFFEYFRRIQHLQPTS